MVPLVHPKAYRPLRAGFYNNEPYVVTARRPSYGGWEMAVTTRRGTVTPPIGGMYGYLVDHPRLPGLSMANTAGYLYRIADGHTAQLSPDDVVPGSGADRYISDPFEVLQYTVKGAGRHLVHSNDRCVLAAGDETIVRTVSLLLGPSVAAAVGATKYLSRCLFMYERSGSYRVLYLKKCIPYAVVPSADGSTVLVAGTDTSYLVDFDPG